MARGRRAAALAGGLCLLCAGTGAAAADSMPNGEIYPLGEIVVSGQRGGASAIETVHTVTHAQMRRVGARTLDEALRLLPGVSVRVGGDGTPRIDIRGLRTRDIRLLINGVPVHSTFDGQFDPRLIPTDEIAKIHLVTGASSELYGDGAMAGVIDIITRKGHGAAHGAVSAETGNNGYRRVAGEVSMSRGNVMTFVSASHRARDDYALSGDFQPTSLQPGERRINSDQRFNNVYANLLYTPASPWQYGLTLTHVDGQYGIPPSALVASTDPFASKAKYERITGLNGYTAQGVADYRPGGQWSMRNWLYVTDQWQQDSIYDNANFDSFLNHNSASTQQETLTTGGHLQSDWTGVARGHLAVALDARREQWSEAGFIRNVPVGGGGGGGGGGGSTTYALRTVDDSLHVDVASLGVEYNVQPWRRTGLVLGAGHHIQRRAEGDFSANSLVAGIYRDIGSASRLHLSVARKIRLPSIRQLYDVTSGNPNLQPEHSLNYEIGLDSRVAAHAHVRASAYTMKVENFIEKDQTTNLFENYEKYRFRGLELDVYTRLGEAWHLKGAYSYLWSRDESTGTQRSELQYRPSYTLGASLAYAPAHGWYGSLSALRVGHQYYYSRTTPLQKAILEPYTTVDAMLGYRFQGPARGTSVYVRASNLFDKNYAQSYGFPMPGRMVYAGVHVML